MLPIYPTAGVRLLLSRTEFRFRMVSLLHVSFLFLLFMSLFGWDYLEVDLQGEERCSRSLISIWWAMVRDFAHLLPEILCLT